MSITALLKRTALARAGSMTLLAVLLTASISDAYTRGRPRIVGNTLVTDQGTLMRGVDVHICQANRGITVQSQTAGTYTYLRDLGFNSVRLAVRLATNYGDDRDVDDRLPSLRNAVQLAEAVGLYVLIDCHDVGTYDKATVTEFWTKVAPEYKDRTCVIYEVENEPVAWAPEDYRDQNIRDQEDWYKICRDAAPNTPIFLMSYATANTNMLNVTNKLQNIDWSNTLVACHTYHVCDSNGTGLAAHQRVYPTAVTEFSMPGFPNNSMCNLQGDAWGWIKWFETRKTSWWAWFNNEIYHSDMAKLMADARARGYMWTPDNFDNPPVGAYLEVSSDSIYIGDSTSLSWQCYQMTNASINQGIGAVSLAGGSLFVKPTQNTTYTLTASGNGQTYTKSVTVYIKQLRVPENPSGTVAGLDYKYYEGTWTNLPNFTPLTPVKTGTVTNFDISVATAADNFGIQFNGYINIPANGTYRFATASDDGSRLYIGTTLVANNDGTHGVTESSGSIGLQAGKHAIRVEYFEAAGGQSLEVKINGSAIAPSSLFRSTGSVVALPLARTSVTTAREVACYNMYGQRVTEGTARSSTAGVLLFVHKARKGQTARMAVAGTVFKDR